jgi:chemotaxis protein CheC
MKRRFSPEQQDALREAVNIGMGSAATALAQIVKRKTSINVPRVNFSTLAEVPDIFGGAEKPIMTVYLKVRGDLSGVMLFSFDKDAANLLADMVLGQERGKTKTLDEMAGSAVKETAMILSGTYVGALAKLLDMDMLLSFPALAEDMAGAIAENILIETSESSDHSIVAEAEIKIEGEGIRAYIFFVPETASLDRMMRKLGM